MRLGFILILFAGVGIAGFSGYLVMQEFENQNRQIAALRTEASKVVVTKPVYLAAKDIPYGSPLTKEDVIRFEFPEKLLPEGYFDTEEALFGTEEEPLDRLVIRAFDANDLIVARKITEPGQDAGVISRLGTGLRAFSLRVDIDSGSFIRPGDRVDIFWTGRVANQGSATRLILDGVELIAINDQTGSETRAEPTRVSTVTVAVSPKTVATLVQAQSSGKLLISLRGLGDTETVGDLSVTQQEFLGIEEEPEEQVVVEERKCFTKVRRGTETIQTEIPCSE